MHYISNINIITDTRPPSGDHLVINDANIGEILFIVIDHKINSYFETKGADLRLVLLFEKTDVTGLLSISDKMTFALLNIKKEYKKYVMNNEFIDNEIIDKCFFVDGFIQDFVKDKRSKLFKENEDNIIFDFNNTPLDPKYDLTAAHFALPILNDSKQVDNAVRRAIQLAFAGAGGIAAAQTAANARTQAAKTNVDTAKNDLRNAVTPADRRRRDDDLKNVEDVLEITIKAADSAIAAIKATRNNCNDKYIRPLSGNQIPKIELVNTADERNDAADNVIKKETDQNLTPENLQYKGVDNDTITDCLTGSKIPEPILKESRVISKIIQLIVKNGLSKLIKAKTDPNDVLKIEKNKVYRLDTIHTFIEEEYLNDIIKKMEEHEDDDKETFKLNDTVIISSSLFKHIFINWAINQGPMAGLTPLGKFYQTFGLIDHANDITNFDDISISKYILLNRKDILLEQKIFPKYPFFYHLLDDGDPSLCITTNDNKVIPISPNLFYGSKDDKHTFYCKESLQEQITGKFKNLDEIITFTGNNKHPLSSDNT